jgi:hypothetical protein
MSSIMLSAQRTASATAKHSTVLVTGRQSLKTMAGLRWALSFESFVKISGCEALPALAHYMVPQCISDCLWCVGHHNRRFGQQAAVAKPRPGSFRERLSVARQQRATQLAVGSGPAVLENGSSGGVADVVNGDICSCSRVGSGEVKWPCHLVEIVCHRMIAVLYLHFCEIDRVSVAYEHVFIA